VELKSRTEWAARDHIRSRRCQPGKKSIVRRTHYEPSHQACRRQMLRAIRCGASLQAEFGKPAPTFNKSRRSSQFSRTGRAELMRSWAEKSSPPLTCSADCDHEISMELSSRALESNASRSFWTWRSGRQQLPALPCRHGNIGIKPASSARFKTRLPSGIGSPLARSGQKVHKASTSPPYHHLAKTMIARKPCSNSHQFRPYPRERGGCDGVDPN